MRPIEPKQEGSDRPLWEWRGAFENDELNTLHAECFGHPISDDDWWTQVNKFSLGWVCMRLSGNLVGFVNVAWDGGVHAFLIDTLVAPSLQRRGYATALVSEAVKHARAQDASGFMSISIPTSATSILVPAGSSQRTRASYVFGDGVCPALN